MYIIFVMLETPHVVIGAAIATKIPNPAIAIPLAFLSHFVLERVPHWNPHLNTEIKAYGKVTRNSTLVIAFDVLLSLTLGISIASQALPNTFHFWTIMFSGLAAVLPDVVEGPYFFWGMKTKAMEKWVKFQKSIQVDTTPLPGLLTQLITILAAFAWLNG